MTSKSKRRRAVESKASRQTGPRTQQTSPRPPQRQTPPRGGGANRRSLLLGGLVGLLALVVVVVIVVTREDDDDDTTNVPAGNGEMIAGSVGNPSLAEALGCWTEEDQLDPEETTGQPLQWSVPPSMVIDPDGEYVAVLRTNFGDITWELLPDAAPNTVNNFVCLSAAGYYQNVPFHRIVDDFVIQGGDPSGTGGGGPGYRFEDEPVQGEYVPGTVAMANAGPNTNGSQFFIITSDLTERLPKDYNLFARVTDGQEIVDEIAGVEKEVSMSGELSQPVEPVILESVTVFVDGEPIGEPAATPAA